MKDYYTILGVAQTASQKEIKAAFKQAIFDAHPDRQPEELKASANQKAKEILEAYEALQQLDSPDAQEAMQDVSEWGKEVYQKWASARGGSTIDRVVESLIHAGTTTSNTLAFMIVDSIQAEKNPNQNRYWTAFNRGNGYEVRGFPSFCGIETFRHEIKFVAGGELFEFDKGTISPEVIQTLESICHDKTFTSSMQNSTMKEQILTMFNKNAHMVYNITENQKTYSTRENDRQLHTYLANTIKHICAFNPSLFEKELKKTFPNGFTLHLSEWGDTFVPASGGAIYTLDTIEPHERGVMYDLIANKQYASHPASSGFDIPMENFNITMFNLFYGETLVGKIHDGIKQVGLYIERTPLDNNNILNKRLGPWKYQEFGMSKLVLLDIEPQKRADSFGYKRPQLGVSSPEVVSVEVPTTERVKV